MQKSDAYCSTCVFSHFCFCFPILLQVFDLWLVNLCGVLIGNLKFGCKTSSTLFKTNFVLKQCESMGFVRFGFFCITKKAHTSKTARGTMSLRILSHFSQHWPELFFTLLRWQIIPLYGINCINGINFINK